jgi:glycosyltransferase involved in cell wall biosynthesis
MKASICIATHDKPHYLKRVLDSIYRQPITDTDEIEVIVVDDRSENARNEQVCRQYPLQYIRLDGEPGYRNPAKARNVAYRAAKGEVIIAQSDDTTHVSDHCIRQLVEELQPGTFVIAHVFNADFSGNVVPGNLENPEYRPLTCYTGPENPRPFFFLGSLYRRDLYAVGGNDEEFVAPGREDDWFARCLMNGLGLKPVFSTTIVGHHLQHKHLGSKEASAPSYELYHQKTASALIKGKSAWQSASGPWIYE